MMFSDDCVEIDTSVFNASRITKLYGTITRKGADTEERPHRQSRILDIPDYFDAMYAESFFNYSNVMEVMKNRDLGVEDELIGMFYEVSSKRFINTPNEAKAYKWDDFPLQEKREYQWEALPDEDNPFLPGARQ